MSSRGLVRVISTALLLAALSSSAQAFVLYEDPLDGDEVILGTSLKSFFFGLHGDALELPGIADANPSAMGVLVARPYLEAQVGTTWRMALHYDMAATVTSDALAASGGPVAIGRGGSPPRFFPLRWVPAEADTFTWAHTLDWAWSRVRIGPMDFTFGRQPITLGRSAFWSPMDLLSTFAPTQIDTEYKPGVDALRFDFALRRDSTLSIIGVAGEREEDSDWWADLAGSAFAARWKQGFQNWEIGAFAGYVREDAVFGVDGFVDLEVLSLHGEATVTWVPDETRAKEDGDAFARATVGLTWTIPDLTVIVEAHYNGVGEADPDDYIRGYASPRVGIGEVYTLGRYYLGALARWQAHPLLALSFSLMANLRDPSVLLTPGLVYNAAENFELTLGALLPIGASSDIVAGDVNSEFGLYPYFYYLEMKVAM